MTTEDLAERERKFLIRDYTDEGWPETIPYVDSIITQIYLKSHASSERVRARFWGEHLPDPPFSKVRYTHTIKHALGPPGVNDEIEYEITETQFKSFEEHRPWVGTVLWKRRRVFDWHGHTFELDIFFFTGHDHLGPLVLLEVELDDMGEQVDLPPFLDIEKEVTGDKKFSNKWLAKHVVKKGLPT